MYSWSIVTSRGSGALTVRTSDILPALGEVCCGARTSITRVRGLDKRHAVGAAKIGFALSLVKVGFEARLAGLDLARIQTIYWAFGDPLDPG
jgi:hypothetical protein